MHMWRRALVLIVLPWSILSAQDGKLRGRVIDGETGAPLIGATILLTGTSLGAASDLNGEFVLLGIPPGSYTVTASYVGYAPMTIVGIIVHASITTSQDMVLNPTTVLVGEVTVTAERPLIQRNTTNTIRILDQSDVQHLPFRSIGSVLSIMAGVVVQDGVMHIRGGRAHDVAYFVDGAPVTNVFYAAGNRQAVDFIRDAVQEIQVQTGGFSADIGGASAGIVQTTLRTGGDEFHGSLDYATDNVIPAGSELFSTTSRGQHRVIGTVGGPIIGGIRFFLAGQFNRDENAQSIFLSPFSFGDVPMDASYAYSNPSGGSYFLPRTLSFKRNFLPDNWQQTIVLQGSMLIPFAPFKLKISGSYSDETNPLGRDWPGALYNYYWEKHPRNEQQKLFGNIRLTHLLSAATYYEASAWAIHRFSHNIDPDFGANWMKYVDSTTARQSGYVVGPDFPMPASYWGSTGWSSLRAGPDPFSIIYNFEFRHPFAPVTSYIKRSQDALGGSIDFRSQISSTFELKSGARIETWTIRQFRVGQIGRLMEYIDEYGARFYPDSLALIPGRSIERDVAYGERGAVNHYGYDVLGNETDDPVNRARRPVFGSAYVQTTLEFLDLIVNAGLRYEYIDPDIQTATDIITPAWDRNLNYFADPEAQITSTKPTHLVLPRLSFSFPATDRTVFYAMFGKYAQTSEMTRLYSGARYLASRISPISGFSGGSAAAGFLTGPERSTQYEIGFRQLFTDRIALTISGFRKDEQDRLQLSQYVSNDGSPLFSAYANTDFTTVTGVEMTLEMRRTRRLHGKLHYTYTKARGTASDPLDARLLWNPNGGYPLFVSPLDYSQTHRGSIILDYRWSRGEGNWLSSGFGVNAVVRFSSGHPYTKTEEPGTSGQGTAWDAGLWGIWRPTEPVNSSTTPWMFSLDIGLSKAFSIGSSVLEVYVDIRNALNTRHVINLYPTTSSATDDGWLTSPSSKIYRTLPLYETFYRAINLENRWNYILGTGTDVYGTPREMLIGLRVEL